MHHPNFVFAGQRDDFLEKLEIDALSGWVSGKVEDQHLRLWPGGLDRLLEFFKEIDAGN